MKNITKIALTLLASSTLAFAGAHGHWDYEHHGPAQWGEFSETCKIGKEQSPINIDTEATVSFDKSYKIEIHEDYQGVCNVVDNGHSLKITPADGGFIKLHGKTYKLNQFHFHGKSEHTIDGRRYNAVAHFVHIAKDGTVAVVAVMFELGEENPTMQTILDNLNKSVKINPADMFPKDTAHYYHYKGSFTTPPCTEQVQWYILKETVNISKDQLTQLRKYYTDNERPLQPINGRKIEAK